MSSNILTGPLEMVGMLSLISKPRAAYEGIVRSVMGLDRTTNSLHQLTDPSFRPSRDTRASGRLIDAAEPSPS